LVPLLSSVPTEAYFSGPSSRTIGTLARVSTLLMHVGFPSRPDWTGKGGLGLGIPLFPSIEASRAVSSPQTKAPAPSLIFTSNEKPVSRMFSPTRPIAEASRTAIFRCSTAIGYSALT